MIKIFLVNETYAINRGKIITKYKKATYWNESNSSVDAGVLYDFGSGFDTQLTNGVDPIGRALLDNISTEICYDLPNGIRQSNGWNNGRRSSRLHILQSNSVDPFSLWPDDNINKLPLDVPIIYADSYRDYHRDGLPFCHGAAAGRIRQGEFPYRLQEVKVGDSTYTIGIYLK